MSWDRCQVSRTVSAHRAWTCLLRVRLPSFKAMYSSHKSGTCIWEMISSRSAVPPLERVNVGSALAKISLALALTKASTSAIVEMVSPIGLWFS